MGKIDIVHDLNCNREYREDYRGIKQISHFGDNCQLCNNIIGNMITGVTIGIYSFIGIFLLAIGIFIYELFF